MQDKGPGAVLSEGGPWGGSDGKEGEDKKPWAKSRPGSVGPSALDALIRRGRARFGGGGDPGGLPVGGLWRWGLAALILLWIGVTSTHMIGLQERGVVTRFGKYVGTLEPGLRWTLPAPIDFVTKVDVDNIHEIDIDTGPDGQAGENLVLTGDENLIDLAYSVRWSKRDPEQFLFEMQDPEQTIKEVAESAMREAIARVSFDEVIGAASDPAGSGGASAGTARFLSCRGRRSGGYDQAGRPAERSAGRIQGRVRRAAEGAGLPEAGAVLCASGHCPRAGRSCGLRRLLCPVQIGARGHAPAHVL